MPETIGLRDFANANSSHQRVQIGDENVHRVRAVMDEVSLEIRFPRAEGYRVEVL